jgi:hypothetical protein
MALRTEKLAFRVKVLGLLFKGFRVYFGVLLVADVVALLLKAVRGALQLLLLCVQGSGRRVWGVGCRV